MYEFIETLQLRSHNTDRSQGSEPVILATF